MARKTKNSNARRLHRLLGVGAAIFVIFMVLSGLAINHSNSLGLDQHQVSQTFLLDWYGLEQPENIRDIRLGKDWISFAGSHLYFNGQHVAMVSDGVGAIAGENMLVAAGKDELLLLDHDGKLIERAAWGPQGAGPIESIGQLSDGTVAVKAMDRIWLADQELLSWHLTKDELAIPNWSITTKAPGSLHKTITQQYRGDGLNLERVLLDFHSGRVFGPVGVFLYDLLALAVGLMAISGLILWARGRRNGQRNGNGKR